MILADREKNIMAAGRGGLFNHTYRGCSSIDQYEMLAKLGEGTFGEVHKGRSRTTGKLFALKKILVHNERDGFPVTAIREIKLLKMLSHVNVLQLEEMAIERHKSKEPKKAVVYMVTPYMEHDLSGLLSNPDVHFTEPQIKCYMLQLLEGLRYLHYNQILHRDMKAANLLISNKGILQIADFGLARHYDESPPSGIGTGYNDAKRDYTALVVTRWYRPPELFLGLRRYTPAIDMWGVGCVFGEMFKRVPILQGGSDAAQIQMIFDLVGSPNEESMPGWVQLPGCEGVRDFEQSASKINQRFREFVSMLIGANDRLNASACSLLNDLLKLNWRKRISAMSALQHPYFRAHPPPARPHDLPVFQDSHELDHRKARGQKGLPPAPAGGAVGMEAQGAGEWPGPPPVALGGSQINGSAQHHASRSGSLDTRQKLAGDYDVDDRRPQPPGATISRKPGWARHAPEFASNTAQPAPNMEKDTYVPSYAGSGPPARDRDRDWVRGTERDTYMRSRERDPIRDSRENRREYESHRNHDHDRNYVPKDRDRDWERERERGWEWERERDRDRDRAMRDDGGRARDRDRDREWNRGPTRRERDLDYGDGGSGNRKRNDTPPVTGAGPGRRNRSRSPPPAGGNNCERPSAPYSRR